MRPDLTTRYHLARPWLYAAAGFALAALFSPGLLRLVGLRRIATKGAKASAALALRRALKK